MSDPSVLEVLRALNSHEKALLMARISLQFTIAARDAYGDESSAVARLEWLKYLNELQHRLAGQSIGYLGEEACYPDDVVAGVLTAPSGDVALDSWIRHCVNRAIRAMKKTP